MKYANHSSFPLFDFKIDFLKFLVIMSSIFSSQQKIVLLSSSADERKKAYEAAFNKSAVPLEQLINEVSKCTLLIETSERRGTAFLCTLPVIYNNKLLTGFITNHHVLGFNDIINKSAVKLYSQNNIFSETSWLFFKKKCSTKEFINWDTRFISQNEALDYTFIQTTEEELGTNFPWLVVSSNCSVGDKVYTIHHAGGGELKITSGDISQIYGNDIVHTANLMGGCSGSALVNNNCEVIGLNKAVRSNNSHIATEISPILDDIRKNVEIQQKISKMIWSTFMENSQIEDSNILNGYFYNASKSFDNKKSFSIFTDNLIYQKFLLPNYNFNDLKLDQSFLKNLPFITD